MSLRVLHFIHSLTGGGTERQLIHLVNNSDPAYMVNAICCADRLDYSGLREDVKLIEVPLKWKYDFRARPIAGLIELWRPHIVHIWLPYILPSSIFAVRRAGIKKIVASYRSVYKVDSIPRLIEVICLAFAMKIVSNVESADMNFPFRSFYHWKAGEYIPNGIDIAGVAAAQPISIEELGLRPGVKTILFAGRLIADKNVKTLLDAFSLLTQRGVEAQMIICGKGEDEMKLKAYTQSSGNASRIIFAGYRDDIYEIMKQCDVFVLPSFREGMPNVLFEAMAAKLPVIASDIPVHHRWIKQGKNGLLFDPSRPDELANILSQSFDEPFEARCERIENAYQTVEGLTIEGAVESYMALYTRLANR